MARNGVEFVWTKQKEEAAALVAEKRLTEPAIAEKVGISRRQLVRWKADPAFEARRKSLVEAWELRVRDKLLASTVGRVDSYIADFDATDVILRERGEELKDIGGGSTGFIARDYKGKDADTPVYMFDAALFRERANLRKLLAEELGQLVKRTELTGRDGKAIEVKTNAVELLESRIAGIAARTATPSSDPKSGE